MNGLVPKWVSIFDRMEVGDKRVAGRAPTSQKEMNLEHGKPCGGRRSGSGRLAKTIKGSIRKATPEG